ncbi:STAS domain-containing protein [Amycolatopsis sp. NPDC005961]|uniref:STAS domain-containing protein n=1 Tax=Amycolatopsis sp. NPDC005961 TaxID=3156720 RepID=UPI00340F1CD0
MTTYSRPGEVRTATAHDRLPAPRAPADLRTEVRCKSADAIVVEVAGEIDGRTAPRLRATLAGHLRARPAVLRVDLGEVGFLGSAGLEVLLQAQRDAEAAGVHLVVDPGRSHAAGRALRVLGDLGGPVF